MDTDTTDAHATPIARAGEGKKSAGRDSMDGRGVEEGGGTVAQGTKTGDEMDVEGGEVMDAEHEQEAGAEGGRKKKAPSGVTQSPQVSVNDPYDVVHAQRWGRQARPTATAPSLPSSSEGGRNGDATPAPSGVTQSPQVSVNDPYDGADAQRWGRQARLTTSAPSVPSSSEGGRNVEVESSRATQSRGDVQAGARAGGNAPSPPAGPAHVVPLRHTSSYSDASKPPARPIPIGPRGWRPPDRHNAPAHAASTPAASDATSARPIPRPRSNAPAYIASTQAASAAEAGPSSGRKRSPSPLDDHRPAKRTAEQRTHFRPYHRTEEQWQQQRTQLTELEEKTKDQKKTIEALEERIAELARDKYVLLKYGQQKWKNMKHDDYREWTKIFAQCWKKEFNERYNKYDDYEDLSDGERGPYTETGTNTDATVVSTTTRAKEAEALTPADARPSSSAQYDGGGDDYNVQMDDATYDDTAQGSVSNAAAHFPVPAGPEDPEERTIPSDAVAHDAERAAAAQEHVSIDAHLARLAAVHTESSTINQTERVEAVRYVPAGKAAGNYLPLPLGKEGHPYKEGWAWGWFQTRRLVRTQCKKKDFVDPTTPLFRRLAIEASRLDICYRSATQREVVCIALCIPELRSALYFTVPEPDILEICRTNATRLPAAIRRQYYVPIGNGDVWSEFDVVDVSIYCGLHAGRPQPKTDKQTQLRRWNEVLDYFFMEWLPLQTDASMQPKFQPFPRGGEPYPNELPEDWKERADVMYEVWAHLLACGFTTRSMRHPGEVWFYMARSRRAERDRALLANHCRQENPNAKQTEVRQWSTQFLVWPPMQYGRAAIRVKVSDAQRDLYWLEYEGMFKDMGGRWAKHNETLTREGLEPDVFYEEGKVCRPWIPLYTP